MNPPGSALYALNTLIALWDSNAIDVHPSADSREIEQAFGDAREAADKLRVMLEKERIV